MIGALVWMNEPPHVDPRAACVVIGAIVAVLAVLQAPVLRQLSASLVIVTLRGRESGLEAFEVIGEHTGA